MNDPWIMKDLNAYGIGMTPEDAAELIDAVNYAVTLFKEHGYKLNDIEYLVWHISIGSRPRWKKQKFKELFELADEYNDPSRSM